MTKQSDTRLLLEWRLTDLLESPWFRRLERRIDASVRTGSIDGRWAPIIKAIMLVEIRERPAPVRAVEWVLSLLPARRMRRITRGPLQMRRAPRRFEAALMEAQLRLQRMLDYPPASSLDVRRLAAAWNGADVQQVGAAVSYQDALSMALRLVTTWPRAARP
jgi:hypothetical protein